MQFLDIILIAAIAAFLIFRLRSVLGRKDGTEGRPGYDPFQQKERGGESPSEDTVVHLPDRESEPAKPAPPDFGSGGPAEGMKAIHNLDGSFDPQVFVGGARQAFEIIVAAFAEGDKQALRPLLANDVYEDFAGAIDARQSEEQSLETTLVSIDSAEIIEAELQGKSAFVTVKFVSQQINVTRDSEGRILEGAPGETVAITDIWTFARNTRSRDPNWSLVATRSQN
ncbi:MAG: Tim44/TimA family putative adaptor protein [Rhodovibrionaceae bacterium]